MPFNKKTNFRVGDTVVLHEWYDNCKFKYLKQGTHYTILEIDGDKDRQVIRCLGVVNRPSICPIRLNMLASYFVFANVSHVVLSEDGGLEVVHPVQSPLSTRKDNKIKMELVETGFPNALLALGQVMTWAAENKGYLPNDWKNIPNPQDAFLGAASRHRMERMKGVGEDDESGLPHLAHECFNVLAQLELLITGRLV